MFSKRDEINIINEILNKHKILYGSELFYRLVIMINGKICTHKFIISKTICMEY